MTILKYSLVLLFSLTLWGCSKGNNGATPAIDPGTGKHVIADWKTGLVHGGVDFGASKDMTACQECHGKDFKGGISKVSCLNTAGCHGANAASPHPQKPWRGGQVTHVLVKESGIAACAECHTKGNNLSTPLLTTYNSGAPGCFNGTLCHGQVGHAASDPQPWEAPANHGANPGTVGRPGAKFSIQACQSCHATPSSGQNPSFTLSKTGMSGGCSTPGCHDEFSNPAYANKLAHPYVWLPNKVAGKTTSHTTAKDLSASCGLCHGASLNGVGGQAPSCMSSPMTFGSATIVCHANTNMVPSVSNPSPVACASCHTTPPSGASFPNTASAHPKHPFACNYCHLNLGTGTAPHANGTPNVSLNTAVAQVGSGATFNGTTKICSNITCHGGATTTTPDWRTTGAGCTACHGTPPNGSSFPNIAGAHAKHTALSGVGCADCHQGAGSGTVKHADGTVDVVISTTYLAKTPDPAKNGGLAAYNTSSGTCDNVSCHGGKTTPAWTVAANTINLASALSCRLCHNITSADLAAGMPLSAAQKAQAVPYATAPFDQYNNAGSGVANPSVAPSLHFEHMINAIGLNITCLSCHPSAKLTAVHFANLPTISTHTMNASSTIATGGLPSTITTYTYTPPATTRTCGGVSAGCHFGGQPDPIDWTP